MPAFSIHSCPALRGEFSVQRESYIKINSIRLPWNILIWIIVWITSITVGARSPSVGQTEALRQLRIAQSSTNLLILGYFKDSRIQVYLTNQEHSLMLQAHWEVPRVKAHKFSYASATLEPVESVPLPIAESGWRRIRVLDHAQSQHLLQAAREKLVPTQVGHGIYCRYAFGDGILFRDANGRVQSLPAKDKPEEVSIDRRYLQQELASAVVKAIETNLQTTFPGDRAWMVLAGSTHQFRLVLIDLDSRQTVVLYAPQGGKDPRPSAQIALRFSHLASFAVVDNAWAFLKNPISSSLRTLNQAIQWTATLLEPRLRKKASSIPSLKPDRGMDLGTWEQWLDRHHCGIRERGSLRLLIDGDQFFPLFERRISEAQDAVDIHVCIFDRDDVGVEIADRLKQRSTNIEVKVIYDRLNSYGAGKTLPDTPMPESFSPPRSIGAYLHNGGRVRVRPQPNPGFTCDHSKVFLIDARYAFIGGMNLGREYRYEWHDLMAEIQGPIVVSFQRQFDKKWSQLGPWGDCGLAAESRCRKIPGGDPGSGTNGIELRRLYTKTFGRQILRAELAAINRASSHVFFENAYLYDNALILALVRARLRGVDVRVVMPFENDFGAGHKSNLVTANYLLQHGVRVYFYPGMSHIKALEVDGWVCFGSANGDSLSLRLNREVNLATSDAGFARYVRQELFERDFAKSTELGEAVETSIGDHFADALLNLF